MTTHHTQSAGCDLDSLQRFNNRGGLMNPEANGLYVRFEDAARAAQAPQGDTRQGAPSDYVLMPKRLTAENGAKAALSGEFKESVEVTCPTCDGSGDDPDFDGDPTEHGSACLECNGDGTVAQNVPVSWDTIKDIYKAAVALLATPAAHTCTPADERARREQFVAYWRARFQYSADHAFLDEAGNFCTPSDDPIHMNWKTWNDARAAQGAGTAPVGAEQHPDDAAVGHFAAAMKAKMAASRAKGRGGWDNPAICSLEYLQMLLLDHLAKGDPVDIGNFAMMLWNRGEPVAAVRATQAPQIGQQDERYAKLVSQLHYWMDRGDRAQTALDAAEAEIERLSAVLTQQGTQAAAPASASGQVLKGIGKIDGDGWKDVTRKGEVVFVWNTELPRPYKAGQYPRIGNNCGWSASTSQYDFQPATAEEARDAIEAIIDSHRAPSRAAPVSTAAATTASASCTVPPPDWVCTRAAGHDGPCAAHHSPGCATCGCLPCGCFDRSTPSRAADGQQGASRAAPGELRSLLQEFVDYHTKPAGMTLEAALSTDKLGEFLVGVESREKEMVQRACAALALPAQGAVAASTDEPDWRGFLEMWAHDGALQTFSSRERFRKEATALARAPLPAPDDARLEVFIDWYLRGGEYAEINPNGHMVRTTRADILAWLDRAAPTSASAQSSSPEIPDNSNTPEIPDSSASAQPESPPQD